jgi:heme/copper-type cytochrome/quinol oxidase subunit 2
MNEKSAAPSRASVDSVSLNILLGKRKDKKLRDGIKLWMIFLILILMVFVVMTSAFVFIMYHVRKEDRTRQGKQ